MPRGKRSRALQLVSLRLRQILAAAMAQFQRSPEELLGQVETKLASSPPLAPGEATDGRKSEMADDKTNRGQPDRSKINMREDYEVKYWTHHLGVTREELQAAIEKVGNSAAAVRKQLGKAA